MQGIGVQNRPKFHQGVEVGDCISIGSNHRVGLIVHGVMLLSIVLYSHVHCLDPGVNGMPGKTGKACVFE